MFEKAEILECANLAKLAYMVVPDAVAFHCEKTGCDCYVRFDAQQDIAFVVFRGTSSFEDALQDCNMGLAAFIYINTFVHTGFLAQAESAIPTVKQALASHGWRGEIRVTGHSLVKTFGLWALLGQFPF